MQRYNINKQLKKSKRVRIFILLLTFLIVLVALYFVFKDKKVTQEKPTNTGETIKYEPASPQEKSANDALKDELSNKNKDVSNENLSPGSTKTTVTPVIVNASKSSVSAFINGVFEDGGTCTASFSNGSSTLTKNVEGFKNVSNTQCAPFDLESNFLGTGSWTVTVSYVSANASGTSKPQEIK